MKTLEEKLLSRCDRSADCWEWIGYVAKHGYGVLGQVDGPKYAHRLAYQCWHGEIPEGLNVCHHCDNTRCINPAHLFVGTDLDNHRDKVSKGRQPRGVHNYNSKLNDDVVRRLRSGELKPSRKLARELGLADSSHLYLIRSGKYWAHVQ